MEVAGIDIGFGFTKAANGNEFVLFKSVLGEATDIQFSMPIVKSESGPCMHVQLDDQSYFVGDFAERQSNTRQYTLDQEKLISEFCKIFALTALGNLFKSAAPVNIVTGLPVGFYREYHQRFAKLLKGQHEIIFQKTDGGTETCRLNISNLRIIPQPLGSIFNLLLNENGKIVNRELAKQKIGVIDIGFRTTDFCIFHGLQYVERGSSTTDTGIAKSFSVIAKKLRDECKVNVELFRLYNAIESGFIKIRGKEFNISKIRDAVFSHAAGIIASDVDRLWADDWDIDAIVISGGGSMELAKYLEPLVAGNILPMDSKLDARLNNVQGYLKYARYLWANAEPPAKSD